MEESSSKPETVACSWDLPRLQEELCKGAAHQYVATVALLRKHAPQAIREFNAIFIANKGYFKQLEVSTPLELVEALAEIEANAFGSRMLVAGDEMCASITYEYCAEWVAVEELSNINWDERTVVAEHFVYAMQDLGAEFGFVAHVTFEGGSPTVTFSRGGVCPPALPEIGR